MATRAYRRDSRGRFAGGGGGTRVTYGRAGGFKAGNTFGARTRVAGNARSTGRGRMRALGGSAKRAASSRQGQYAIKLTAAGLGAAAASSLASRGARSVVRGGGVGIRRGGATATLRRSGAISGRQLRRDVRAQRVLGGASRSRGSNASRRLRTGAIITTAVVGGSIASGGFRPQNIPSVRRARARVSAGRRIR